MKSISIFAVAVLAAIVVAQHGSENTDQGHTMFTPDDFKWIPGPASLPEGCEMVVIDGDPTKEGLFTMRIWIPPNTTIMPHWHPANEHVTVIRGVFYMSPLKSMEPVRIDGEKPTPLQMRRAMPGTALPSGGFVVMKARQPHFAYVGEEGAEVQLHGMGPWQINYLDPADDPRRIDR